MKENQEETNRPPSINEYPPDERQRIRMKLNRLFAKAMRSHDKADQNEWTAFARKYVRTEETKVRIRGKTVYLEIVAPLQEGRILVDAAGRATIEITDGQHRSSNLNEP